MYCPDDQFTFTNNFIVCFLYLNRTREGEELSDTIIITLIMIIVIVVEIMIMIITKTN